MLKFRGKGQIPWFGSKFCGLRKTVGPTPDHHHKTIHLHISDLDQRKKHTNLADHNASLLHCWKKCLFRAHVSKCKTIIHTSYHQNHRILCCNKNRNSLTNTHKWSWLIPVLAFLHNIWVGIETKAQVIWQKATLLGSQCHMQQKSLMLSKFSADLAVWPAFSLPKIPIWLWSSKNIFTAVLLQTHFQL